MTEDRKHQDRRHIVAVIVAKAWSDERFKKQLLENPTKVMTEYGLEPPPGLKIVMHEDTATIEHGVLPAPPSGLTPEQLADPANVHIVYCFTAFHHRHGQL